MVKSMKYISFTIIIIVILMLSYNKQVIHGNSNYEIQVDYPKTNYNILNDATKNKIDNYIDNFKHNISDKQPNNYSLIIYYDVYHYMDYISYIFYIEYDTGGAHPNHDIWTIVFNTKSNKIVTLDNLITYNENILNLFSKYSREELLYNKKIVDTSMMIEGTRPTKENFSKFVLTNKGIILFFSRYQIAPYSSGHFQIIIPYEYIKNSN